ncbi:MAG TPA: histidinol-phosphatase [Longimicrobiales bacterium]|nr:histidinol-phosphatase [Longimicrobiales bacterium]
MTMNPSERRELLDFAVEVAWRAGLETLAHYQTGAAAETKPDASPVTAADRAAEATARRLIEARHPGDAILGEEEGEEREGAARRWIIDPIDGTRSFMRGVPLYGVLIALEAGDDAVLGVMHFPALQETVYAARGLGCWWNGRRARVSAETRLQNALVLTTDVEAIERAGRGPGWDRLRRSAGLCRTWGDCYGYALVATGRAEAMLDPVLSLWDVAAVVPIVEEAGGVFTDWDGAPGHRARSGVATNAALAEEVRRMLRGGA